MTTARILGLTILADLLPRVDSQNPRINNSGCLITARGQPESQNQQFWLTSLKKGEIAREKSVPEL
jgi:hypothetical protein